MLGNVYNTGVFLILGNALLNAELIMSYCIITVWWKSSMLIVLLQCCEIKSAKSF